MPERPPRGCTRCGAYVPEPDLSCPACGKFYEGGFQLGELVDGIRAVQPDPLVAVADPVVEEWRPAVRSATPEPTFHGLHRTRLPLVGQVADLPYAPDEHGAGSDDEVIDLRDRQARPRTGLLGRRSRSRP